MDTVGGVLRWGLGVDPVSLDPALADGPESRIIADALFDSLTRVGANGQVRPALAASWTVSADGQEVVFRLRDGATYHDGRAVIASDVVRAWTRVLVGPDGGGPTRAAALLAPVIGAESVAPGVPPIGLSAPDATTLVVRTAAPTPDLPSIVAHPALAPVPPAADEPGFGSSPVGNGPFRLAEPWAPNQFVRLARYDDHPAPAVLAGVELRVFDGDADGTRRYEELSAGRLDVGAVPPGRRAEARREFGSADDRGAPGVHDAPTALASVLLLDTTTPPLDDLRVRRALSLLVDREAMAAVSAGDLVVAEGLLPSSLPGALGGGCRYCRFDPAEAALLLEPLETLDTALPALVVVSSDDRAHATMARDLVARLRAAGVPARVSLPSRSDFLGVVGAADAAAARIVWSPVAPDLASWTTRLFGAGAPGRVLSGYGPAALRELLATARGSSDTITRSSADRAALRLLLDDAVVVPLVHYRDDLVTSPAVRGLVRGPLGDVDLSAVRLVPVP